MRIYRQSKALSLDQVIVIETLAKKWLEALNLSRYLLQSTGYPGLADGNS
jgi:hypothetical protein